MPGPEATIERRLRLLLKDLGVPFVKMVTSERGWPDRVALLPEGRVIWVEMKRPGGRVRAYQHHVHKRIMGLGHDVRVVSSSEEAAALASEIEKETKP